MDREPDSGANAKRSCCDGFQSSYSENEFHVVNGLVQPLLTDLYQITMAYAHWKNWKHFDRAVFDMFFRRNPFQGEFTIFAGLEECLRFISDFRFTDSDITYLKELLPDSTEPEFFGYIRSLSAKDVTVYAIAEGSLVFPKVPLLRVEGPLPVVQLMETTLLNLVNYASLVATNAARHRLAAGSDKELIEFGLRRAQGPDGGVSASRYSFIGGFDATSNVLAGKLFGIPVRGTHAHAFVSSFASLSEVKSRTIQPLHATGQLLEPVKFLPVVEEYIDAIADLLDTPRTEMNEGELAAFVAYAISFPNGFLALVDTYDVICSGVPNFCVVACALNQLGYRAVGVRIDSGDLAYLSKRVHKAYNAVAKKFNLPWFNDLKIVASNQITEETLLSLNSQGHQITSFGIGTNLVTCQTQPALGCVFKLVEVDDQPRIKLSQDTNKITMPGRKEAYRLYSRDGSPLVDLLQRKCDSPPLAGEKVLCRHPFEATKRAYVQPARVESLYKVYWKDNKICQDLPSTLEIRSHAKRSLDLLRGDHKRALNPTPYKVSVSESLYTYIHDMWLKHAPIGQLS